MTLFVLSLFVKILAMVGKLSIQPTPPTIEIIAYTMLIVLVEHLMLTLVNVFASGNSRR